MNTSKHTQWAWASLPIGLVVLSCQGEVPAQGASSPGASPSAEGSEPVGAPVVATVIGPDGVTIPIPQAVGVTTTEVCFSPEQSFEWELYGPVFSRCVGCHNNFGLARDLSVPLRFTFPSEPDFAAKNVALLSSYASESVDIGGVPTPLLVAKATGQIAHVGEQLISPDGPEARLLESFVAKLADPPACADAPDDDAARALSGLQMATPKELYVKAKFTLTGEVATPEEVDALEDTEQMLDRELDRLLQTESFLDRAQEMYADWLLTDAYTFNVRDDELMDQLRDFPARDYFRRACTEEQPNNCCDTAEDVCCVVDSANPEMECTEEAFGHSVDAVAREPMALVRHTVANDLPISEIVNANFTMVNPYSAVIYGVPPAQRAQLFDTDPSNDATEYRALRLTPTAGNALRAPDDGVYPHAGVLSMPSLLVRYPSSTSNQQRTRGARVILERMLAIPVMKLSDFTTATLPADADLELATQQYPACTVCHAAIDPISMHFRNFGSQSEFRPGGSGFGRFGFEPPEHLPDASFLGLVQAEGDTLDPLRWLGDQVAGHDRFALGAMLPVLADLIGADILGPPTDVLAPNFAHTYLAFRLQQLEVQRLRAEFAGPLGLRIRPLVKAIVKGPFFRAVGAPGVTDPVMGEALGLAGVGSGVLLTPEQLARKLESVTGYTYRSGLDATGRDMFRSFRDYRLMFGGTDWDATPARYRAPNAMAVRIALRMGNEMACLSVPRDFSINDPAARKLFTHVNLDTVPETGETQIRAQVHRLVRLFWGEQLGADHPEVEQAYTLFAEARNLLEDEGSDSPRGNPGGGGFGRVSCSAVASYDATETPYPTDTHSVVEGDDNNTLRAWMTVVAYLMADARFFLN